MFYVHYWLKANTSQINFRRIEKLCLKFNLNWMASSSSQVRLSIEITLSLDQSYKQNENSFVRRCQSRQSGSDQSKLGDTCHLAKHSKKAPTRNRTYFSTSFVLHRFLCSIFSSLFHLSAWYFPARPFRRQMEMAGAMCKKTTISMSWKELNMTTLSTAHHRCRDINFTPQILNVLKRFLSNLIFAKLLRLGWQVSGKENFIESRINSEAFSKQLWAQIHSRRSQRNGFP